jgi:ABC-2 type transport system permease protein
MYPTPSSFTFAEAIASDVKRAQDGESLGPHLKAYAERRAVRVKSSATGDSESAAASLQQSEDATNLIYEYHYDTLQSIYRAQGRIHTIAAIASPMMSVRALSMALAGTDLEQHTRFANAAEAHRRMMISKLNGMMTPSEDGAPPLSGEALWRSIPPFTHQVASFGEALTPYRFDLVLFAVWAVVAAALLLSLERVRIT